MADTGLKVNFAICTQSYIDSNYNDLDDKTIYFTNDTERLYRGPILYTKPPTGKTYSDSSAMFADMSNQMVGFFYLAGGDVYLFVAESDSSDTSYIKLKKDVPVQSEYPIVIRGYWDASSGSSPALGLTKGYTWIVSIDGSTDLGGITEWKAGDWATFVGSGTWTRVNNSTPNLERVLSEGNSANGQIKSLTAGTDGGDAINLQQAIGAENINFNILPNGASGYYKFLEVTITGVGTELFSTDVLIGNTPTNGHIAASFAFINGSPSGFLLNISGVNLWGSRIYYKIDGLVVSYWLYSFYGVKMDARVLFAEGNSSVQWIEGGGSYQADDTGLTEGNWNYLAYEDATIDGKLTVLDGVNPEHAVNKSQLDLKIDSSEKGAINGVATLDSNQKIPSAQLPNSVMELKGQWNADTNTPTLSNGSGNNGDVYQVSVAGTVDFGAGPVEFKVREWAVYNSFGVWENSPAANIDEANLLHKTGNESKDGWLAIGKSSAPAEVLDVNGEILAKTAVTLEGGTGALWRLESEAGSNYFRLRIGAITALTANSNGLVTIEKIRVFGLAELNDDVVFNSKLRINGGLIDNLGNSALTIRGGQSGAPTPQPLVIGDANTSHTSIGSTSIKTKIGSTSVPSEALDVTGNGKFSGNIISISEDGVIQSHALQLRSALDAGVLEGRGSLGLFIHGSSGAHTAPVAIGGGNTSYVTLTDNVKVGESDSSIAPTEALDVKGNVKASQNVISTLQATLSNHCVRLDQIEPVSIVTNQAELVAADVALSGTGGRIVFAANISLSSDLNLNLNGIRIDGRGYVLTFNGYKINISGNRINIDNIQLRFTATPYSTAQGSGTLLKFTNYSTTVLDNVTLRNCGTTVTAGQEHFVFDSIYGGTIDFVHCKGNHENSSLLLGYGISVSFPNFNGGSSSVVYVGSKGWSLRGHRASSAFYIHGHSNVGTAVRSSATFDNSVPIATGGSTVAPTYTDVY